MENIVKGKNKYIVYFDDFIYPIEISADDFIIDGECVTFVLNDCQLTKIGMFKNYRNVVLVEKDTEMEKYKSIIKDLDTKYNRSLQQYKYLLLFMILLTITILTLWIM